MINSTFILNFFQWFYILYFLVMGVMYLFLEVISLFYIKRYVDDRSLNPLPRTYDDYYPPVSLLVPCFNEGQSIVPTVQSLLNLNYPELEVIVINDGSTDNSLQVLTESFDLIEVPETYRNRLSTRPLGAIFRSKRFPNLRVISKENGGKSDALNAGINLSKYPLFCSVDADSILQRDSLLLIAKPFLEDPYTVSSGGTVRILNGCTTYGGYFAKAALPNSFLARLQVVEYLRAFLFGRLGWSPLNALLIISGTFGLFHKETVIEIGGYRTDTIGEDMELVVRLHRILRSRKRKFKIKFVPDPICWTKAPDGLRSLFAQRKRWQRGLIESLMSNKGLMFHPRGGIAGWFAFPYMVIFEMLSPIIEISGFVYIILGFLKGFVEVEAFILFFLVSIGFGVLISVIALLLEEISYRLYKKASEVIVLLVDIVIENFFYRQLVMVFRLFGILGWLFNPSKKKWGYMDRRDNQRTFFTPWRQTDYQPESLDVELEAGEA